SMASFIRYGCASWSIDAQMIATSARAAYRRYGRRYASRRRISRASYAFPRTSSSCIVVSVQPFQLQPSACRISHFSLASTRLQFLFEELLSVQGGVEPAAGDQLVVIATFRHSTLVEHEDLVRVPNGGNAMRHDN